MNNEQISELSLKSMHHLQEAADGMKVAFHASGGLIDNEFAAGWHYDHAVGYINNALAALGLKAVPVDAE